MSDKPLFQDADEQEATYGDSRSGASEADGAVIIPGAAAVGGVLAGQLGTGATGSGTAPAAAAAIAGANRSSSDDLDDDGVIEDDERR